MDLESLFGLPAHPLVVHGAVVLLPLAAAGTIVIAAVPRPKLMATVLIAVALATGIGATWSVVDVGHSGAKATWTTVQDADSGDDD